MKKIVLLTYALVLAGAGAAGATTPGTVWMESESSNAGTYSGRWTWDGARQVFVARWNNGATATLSVVRADAQNVVLRRSDAGGASNGMTAEYVGVRTGNTIRGTVTWYYRGGKGTGTWTATVAGPATPVAVVWRESESSNIGTFTGTWTWNPTRKQFSAKWNNGAQAMLSVVSDDGRTVVLRRFDPSGASATMSAEYIGVRSGNTIRGTVTWFYRGGKNSGTWSASW